MMPHAPSPRRSRAHDGSRTLSGRWAGHYTRNDRLYPVQCSLFHDGRRLCGAMRDATTLLVGSLSDLVTDEGLPPGQDERILERLRRLCPEGAGLPVATEIELPADSRIEGETSDRWVRFIKTYLGEYFAGFRVGSRRIGVRGSDQRVVHRGWITADGCSIEGQWFLLEPRRDVGATRVVGGSFFLERVSSPALAKRRR